MSTPSLWQDSAYTALSLDGAAEGEGKVQPLQTPISNVHGWSSSQRCLLFVGCGLVGQSDNLDGFSVSLNRGLKADLGIRKRIYFEDRSTKLRSGPLRQGAQSFGPKQAKHLPTVVPMAPQHGLAAGVWTNFLRYLTAAHFVQRAQAPMSALLDSLLAGKLGIHRAAKSKV